MVRTRFYLSVTGHYSFMQGSDGFRLTFDKAHFGYGGLLKKVQVWEQRIVVARSAVAEAKRQLGLSSGRSGQI